MEPSKNLHRCRSQSWNAMLRVLASVKCMLCEREDEIFGSNCESTPLAVLHTCAHSRALMITIDAH